MFYLVFFKNKDNYLKMSYLKVKKTDKMQVLMNKFAELKKIPLENLRFKFILIIYSHNPLKECFPWFSQDNVNIFLIIKRISNPDIWMIFDYLFSWLIKKILFYWFSRESPYSLNEYIPMRIHVLIFKEKTIFSWFFKA